VEASSARISEIPNDGRSKPRAHHQRDIQEEEEAEAGTDLAVPETRGLFAEADTKPIDVRSSPEAGCWSGDYTASKLSISNFLSISRLEQTTFIGAAAVLG
jgi:hypothetical protein